VADPEPDIPIVLEGEAAQMAEAAGKFVLGVGVESSDDRIFDPRKDEVGEATAVFRMIYFPGDENDAFFLLQFTFMPIPPWGCDTNPGINSISDITFLLLYPTVNGVLIYIGYPLFYLSLRGEKTIYREISALSIGLLWLGKGIFESIIIASMLMEIHLNY